MTNFKADTLSDFIEAAAKEYGAGSLGKTEPVTTREPFLFKDGKLTKVSFTFKATVDFAAFGGGSTKGSPTRPTGTPLRKLSNSRWSTRGNTRPVTRQPSSSGTHKQ
jgi:hypothetical protein